MNHPRTPITVTAEDIARGAARSCSRCPLARAVARHLAVSRDRVVVAGGNVVVMNHTLTDREAVYPLPVEAINFYLKFDRWIPVAPFTFTLEEPV